jgi:hypothetical protein
MATRVNRYAPDLDLEVVSEALGQELYNMIAVDITANKHHLKHFQISVE